ncbi:MAG TPA: hypothetical protein VE052_08930 [Gemmatimonadaceae bacterium]|nr:hypothetical protein [Gemmatimonadaceae bacterium]
MSIHLDATVNRALVTVDGCEPQATGSPTPVTPTLVGGVDAQLP